MAVETLAGYINSRLEPFEKIPITQSWFDNLVSPLYPDICSQDDVANLFNVTVEPNFDPNFILFFYAVSNPPPPPGTKYSFVFFWDLNIRCIPERLLPAAKVIRNRKCHTLINDSRPDHALLIDNLCIWRGEEKADGSGDPKGELRDKLVWVYDDAPYILGEHLTL